MCSLVVGFLLSACVFSIYGRGGVRPNLEEATVADNGRALREQIDRNLIRLLNLSVQQRVKPEEIRRFVGLLPSVNSLQGHQILGLERHDFEMIPEDPTADPEGLRERIRMSEAIVCWFRPRNFDDAQYRVVGVLWMPDGSSEVFYAMFGR